MNNESWYEDPLELLKQSFTVEQEHLWEMYLRGEKVRCSYSSGTVHLKDLSRDIAHRTNELNRNIKKTRPAQA